MHSLRLLIGFLDILGILGVARSQFLELVTRDDVILITLALFVAFQIAVIVDHFLGRIRVNL